MTKPPSRNLRFSGFLVVRVGFEDTGNPAIPDTCATECEPSRHQTTSNDAQVPGRSHVDLVKLEALAVAARELLRAGLGHQARSLVEEIVTRLEEARAPVGQIINIRSKR